MKLLRKIIHIIQETIKEWTADDASRMAAALAYYTIFSLAPLLVVSISIASLIWPRSEIETQVYVQLQSVVGSDVATFVQSLVKNGGESQNKGFILNLVGIGALVFGSLGIFRALRTTMNRIWNIEIRKKKGFFRSIQKTARNDLQAFVMVLALGLLLVASILINSALSVVSNYTAFLPFQKFWMGILNNGVTLAVITVIFAVIFKYLPETEIGWKDVFIGGFVTAVLFLIGKLIITLYLGSSSVVTTFGAAGSLVILMIWIYYSSQILFLGAEFTQVYAALYGCKASQLDSKQASLPAAATKENENDARQNPHQTAQAEE